MKKIISLLLIMTMLLTTLVVNASAARVEEFISEVALVYEDSVEEAKAAIAGTDWKLLEQDLNANADYMFDNGVYLIYKTSTNVEDAITDLRVMDMYGGYSSSNYDKQLEASRAAYLQMVAYIRTTAAEFKARYDAGDEMAKLAYRQMNYYKDIGETDMFMGDFMLNLPSDDAIVTALMEGNTFVITNLVTLLAIGLSGGNTFVEKLSATYAIKDTLTDADYYDDAVKFSTEFQELAAKVKRYNALADQYNLTDENMSEEEFQFISEYGSIALILEQIPYGDETLKDFISRDGWTIKDTYPIVAALSEGQLALAEMGVFTTILQYSSPSASIDALYELVEETEKEITDENGNLKIFDVYMGVDRSIFEGNFAFTTAAERQQAITGMEWTASYYLDKEADDYIPYTLFKSLLASGAVVALAPLTAASVTGQMVVAAAKAGNYTLAAARMKVFEFLVGNSKFLGGGGAAQVFLCAGIGLMVASLGVIGVSIWYGYYNPDYTPIPNTLIDVRETDLGDKYIKYTVAKVYNDEDGRNADFNAYEGKEWIALYYTKDATAGYCLTPNFVFSDNNATIARRHQGISMFGETTAFNLNSHVYSSDAKGAYVTIRYSTTKKAAADLPTVVGSMFATGAVYTLTALAGAGVGVGGTLLLQKAKKRREEAESEESN